MNKPKTRKQVENHPAVAEVEHLPGEDCPWWIYLKDGWTASNDPHSTHQGNGRTLREAIDDVWPIQKCECNDCQRVAVA